MTLLDPAQRWGPDSGKPGYAGLLTFAGMPYTESAEDLKGVDVAIIGAPFDDLVSERPGTRFAPRAIRAASCPHGVHLEAKVDGLQELEVIDFGDAPCVPGDHHRSHESIRSLVAEVAGADVVPVILGGDHSIAEPDIAACSEKAGGPIGLIHFDTHTDTASEVFGVTASHGTPFRHLVEGGSVDPKRYVQIGLRGYWPGPETFSWQEEVGITNYRADQVESMGIDQIIGLACEQVAGGSVFLSVDLDVLDPAYAPGVGDPQPGGLSSSQLLRACREVAARTDLRGAELVELIPTAIGEADVTAVVAERIAREVINGIALHRRFQNSRTP